MKFSQLPERNAQAIQNLLAAALEQRRRESNELSVKTLHALILGNIGGVALLMTLAAALIERGDTLLPFRWPIGAFLLGAVSGAFANLTLVGVLNEGVEHMSKVIGEFVQDQRAVADMAGYGFSKRGRFSFSAGTNLAIICWVAGVVWSFAVLLR